MSEWKTVTKDELGAFVKNYPRPLKYDCAAMCEPPLHSWSDTTLGDWPASMVARSNADGGWEIRTGEPSK